MSAVVAYPAAVLVGVLAGLLAGKPIWAKDARIEAGLKAVFGGLLAAGLTFALRSWAKLDLDLTRFGLGKGMLGELAVTALPLISVLLSVVFEVDNLFGQSVEPAKERKRVATAGSPKLRAAASEGLEHEAASDSDDKRGARRKG